MESDFPWQSWKAFHDSVLGETKKKSRKFWFEKIKWNKSERTSEENWKSSYAIRETVIRKENNSYCNTS